jgi:hypothetical protein
LETLKSFFDARLRARLRVLEAARDAALVGDEERGGALKFGGGGNVVLAFVRLAAI